MTDSMEERAEMAMDRIEDLIEPDNLFTHEHQRKEIAKIISDILREQDAESREQTNAQWESVLNSAEYSLDELDKLLPNLTPGELELLHKFQIQLINKSRKAQREACADAITKVIYPGETAYLLPDCLRELDKRAHDACMNVEVKEWI
ncbi:MAG: hypothetical protein WC390_08720 [Sulfurimonas sp.]